MCVAGMSLLIRFLSLLFFLSVCDETCRETVMDPANELLVCKISGHCLDRLLSAAEMEPDAVSRRASSSTLNFLRQSFFFFFIIYITRITESAASTCRSRRVKSLEV